MGEDWRVIDAWTAYAMVYTLMFLGVYELSNIDLVRGAAIRYLAYQGELSSGKPHTPMGKALLRLQSVWRDAPTDEDKTSAALQEALELGLKHSYVTQDDLLKLTMGLAIRHKETGPTGATLAWAEQHVSTDQQFCASDPNFVGSACVAAALASRDPLTAEMGTVE